MPDGFSFADGRRPSPDELDAEVSRVGQTYGVPPALIRSVIHQESGGDPYAVSPQGAGGLMQLEPDTAAGLGVSDLFDWRQNLDGGTRYLKQGLDRYGGNPTLAAAYYHGGPNEDQWGPRTAQYADAVTSAYQKQPAAPQPAGFSFEDATRAPPVGFSFEDAKKPQGFSFDDAQAPDPDEQQERPKLRDLTPALTEDHAPTHGGDPALMQTEQPTQDQITPQLQAKTALEDRMVPQPGARTAPPAVAGPGATNAPGAGSRLSRIGSAIADAWTNSPTLLTPQAQAWLDKTGLGGVTRLADIAMAAPNAIFAGMEQGAVETGQATGFPQTGKGAAELMEYLTGPAMGDLPGMRVPVAREAVPREASPAVPATPARPMPTLEAMAGEAKPPSQAAAVTPEAPVTPEAHATAELTNIAEGKPAETPPVAAPAPPPADVEVSGAAPGAPMPEATPPGLKPVLDANGQWIGYERAEESAAPAVAEPVAPEPATVPPVPEVPQEGPPTVENAGQVGPGKSDAAASGRAGAGAKAPVAETPFEPIPKEPERLSTFLRRMGGVQDVGGDIRSSLGGSKYRPGLINKKGLPLDTATQRAWESGYFPQFGDTRPAINDLREALHDDLNGRPVYSHHDEGALAAYQESTERNTEIDRLSNEHSIPTQGKTRAQFFDELADRMSQDEAAAEAEAQAAAHADEYEYAAAEKAAKAWVADHPDESGGAGVPTAAELYGQSQARTLEDLEREHQQASPTPEALERAARGEEPEPAGVDQGAVPEGGEPRGGGAGARRGDEAEAPANGGWFLVDKATSRPVSETFDPKIAASVNREKYEAVPVAQYLADYNRRVKEAGGVEPPATQWAPQVDERGVPNSPPTDLLGRPAPQLRAPRVAEPTIRTDARQDLIPGTEPSAVQAQAARDVQGRGALQTDVTQKPANEGLFAPDTSGQGTLYSFPGALFDPEAWKRLAPAVQPMWRAAKGAMTAVKDVGDSIATGLAPMRSGTVRSQAFAANFANSLRQVQYRFGQIDKEIERTFTPGQRDQMGRALDAQSVFEQQVRDLPAEQQATARAEFDAGGTGIASLNPAQRHAVEMLDAISLDTWRQMQERGMVEPNARPIPYYFPRQMVQWSEAEGFTRAGGQGGGGRGIDARGQNLTTAGPMRREHLTPEETEAAARAKLGAGTQLLRDIRSLPQRLAFAHRAIAGVDLMSKIEQVGRDTGVDLVVRGDIPGLLQPGDYFTMADHPSFRRWTGSGWQPVNVAKEFEGPLKAVLTQRSPTWYRAAQMLKGGIMTSIMYSPFIHLGVELGRAFPVMPGKIITLQALRDGSRLRRDLSYMDQATRDGLAPLGQSWHADPVSIADAATVDSKTGFLSAVRGVRDAIANGAGKIGGQTLHDIMQHPHQTLLWDQVFNLQVGIYNTMRDRYIAKGFEPDVAGTMAAHIANRYAGALPPEHLSRGANMAANLLLFSRSFTLGNLGVMKDMFTGAPSHIRARIEDMAGPEVARSAQSQMRRKAISAVTMDIGLFYLANGLLQAGLQVMRQAPDQGLPAAAQQTYQQWLDDAHAAMSNVAQNPLDAFGVLPQHWNEPGKQDRVYAGKDSQGRGIYLRLPPGKVGEEFLGWMAKPGVLLENKASPLLRPIIESIFGQDTMGRPIYKPNPQSIGDGINIAGAVVKHIAEGLGPTSTIQGLHELYQQHVEGKPTQADPLTSAMKVLGPLTGLAQVSQGYPGGPAAGELHALSESQRYDQLQAMPEIRDKIRSGDTASAVEQMTALRVPRALQRYYIRQTLNPGPSRSGMRNLPTAPAAVQERVQRQLQQQ